VSSFKAALGLWCALSFAGCSCGSRHHGPDDDRSDEDGSLDPHAGEGGGRGDDASAGSAGRDGASGHDAQAGSAGEDAADELIDPPPIEIDRSGLVPTSGSHAVLLTSQLSDETPRRLIAVDLARGETHLLVEDDELSFAYASPDGSAILFGGNRILVRDFFSFARLLDDGIVPATPIAGFEEDRGHRGLLGWTHDGRFALLSRTSRVSEHGLDLVDVHAGARHWSTESDRSSSMNGHVAPRGSWFSYAIDGQGASSGVARITEDGLHQVAIPELDEIVAYSPNGTRVLYTLPRGTEESRIIYRDLRAGAQGQELVVDQASGTSRVSPLSFSLDDDHVLAQVTHGSGSESLERIDLRTGASTKVVLPGTGFGLFPSADGSTVLGIATDFTTLKLELWLIDALGESASVWLDTLQPMPATTEGVRLQIGSAGPRHLWYSLGNGPLTFVTFASTGLAATDVVSEPQDAYFSCLPEILAVVPDDSERVAFLAGDGEALIVLDLASELERLARIEPAHGGKLGCPVWNADHNALAFVEQVDGETPPRTYLYELDWPTNGRAPQLVFESEPLLDLIAYRP
jgi:hypothetical protein